MARRSPALRIQQPRSPWRSCSLLAATLLALLLLPGCTQSPSTPATSWMHYDPLQCQAPWESGYAGGTEVAKIEAYLAFMEVEPMNLTTQLIHDDACETCGCQRPERIYVLVAGKDADTLERAGWFPGGPELDENLGSIPTSTWYSFDPVQCGGNPWDENGMDTPRDEENATVRAHYETRGVSILSLEWRRISDVVDTACQSWRGDRFWLEVDSGQGVLRNDGWKVSLDPDAEDDGDEHGHA